MTSCMLSRTRTRTHTHDHTHAHIHAHTHAHIYTSSEGTPREPRKEGLIAQLVRHAKGQKTLFAKDGVAILLKRAKAIVGETVEMTDTMCDLCVTMHSCVVSDVHMSVLSAFSVRESVVLFLLFF